MKTAVLAVCFLVAATAATAMPLPGVRTPTGNIVCFYVPQRPTTHGNLLCQVKVADYARVAQAKCLARAGLDWHGFELPSSGAGDLSCTGGILYDSGRDHPAPHTLAYGTRWRYRGFTCVSRRTGLTCTNRAGHGLILSRQEWRAW